MSTLFHLVAVTDSGTEKSLTSTAMTHSECCVMKSKFSGYDQARIRFVPENPSWDCRCSFAYPGTYGHECGHLAVWVGVKRSTMTKSGVYYARRCSECKEVKGGENTGVTHFEPFDPEKHRNEFK